MNTISQKEKKKREFPHVYIILFALVVVCAALTYIIPAGEYDRVQSPDGRMLVDPDSFHFVERSPVGFFDVIRAMPKGCSEVADIIFFILIVGGSFEIIKDTGAIDAGIGKISKTMYGKEKYLIPVIMFAFALGAATFGMSEETLPFISIMIAMTLAMGFDSLTGLGMVIAGAGAGFVGTFMNPFTIGVAQEISGLPLFSAIGYRVVMFFTLVTAAVIYVSRYAAKVKKNPQSSMMYEIDKNRKQAVNLEEVREMNNRDKLVLLTVAVTVILLIIGATKWDWGIIDMSALFLGMAIVAAVFSKMRPNLFAERLVIGMASMVGNGALVTGFGRAVMVVLTDGKIIDTILYGAASMVSALPSSLTVLGMLVFQCFLSFIIPSGTGQAVVTMPIMAPLADLTEITRQTAVIAFQIGDGVSNILTPTSGYFMAALAIAGVTWDKWIKWFIKLAAIEYLIGAIFLLIAHFIKLGPF